MTDSTELTVNEDSPRSLRDNTKLRKQARHMYYQGFYVSDIVEHLNVDIDELGFYVFGSDGTGKALTCWSHIKLHRPPASLVSYTELKPIVLKSAEAKIFNRIAATAEQWIKEDRVFSADEMSKAMSIIEKMDKISRLEEGKITSRMEVVKRTFSLRELEQGVIDEDIEDVDFKEVEPTEMGDSTAGSGEGSDSTDSSEEEIKQSFVPPDSDAGSGSGGDTGAEA